VRDQISIIEGLLPTCTGARRAEFVTLALTYAESAAWLYEDSGQMPAATFWVGRAMEWAHEAGDEFAAGVDVVPAESTRRGQS
jgi:hypothetical protein